MAPSFVERLVIHAPARTVWESLTRVELMPEWMADPRMEVRVETDWTVGGAMVVCGVLHQRPFRNTGRVVAFEPYRRLAYTHLSSLSDLPDEPASHTTFAFTLSPAPGGTALDLIATGFPTESIFRHLRFYWGGALACLGRQAERRAAAPPGVGCAAY